MQSRRSGAPMGPYKGKAEYRVEPDEKMPAPASAPEKLVMSRFWPAFKCGWAGRRSARGHDQRAGREIDRQRGAGVAALDDGGAEARGRWLQGLAAAAVGELHPL